MLTVLNEKSLKMSEIKTINQLEALYPKPSPRAQNKVLPTLDRHAKTMVNHSHFVILSTCDALGFTDVSPRGGAPGFIKVIDNSTILIPDSSGNNRLDSLRNIINNPKIGLLIMVSGIDEVIRIKGRASIHTDSEILVACPDGKKAPKVVIKVTIESLYFHCAKAIMRGKLWSGEYKVERSILPSLGQILKEQQSLDCKDIDQKEMVKYYKSTL